jgi:hypothetical protein
LLVLTVAPHAQAIPAVFSFLWMLIKYARPP